jgi:hypothetical protein
MQKNEENQWLSSRKSIPFSYQICSAFYHRGDTKKKEQSICRSVCSDFNAYSYLKECYNFDTDVQDPDPKEVYA